MSGLSLTGPEVEALVFILRAIRQEHENWHEQMGPLFNDNRRRQRTEYDVLLELLSDEDPKTALWKFVLSEADALASFGA